MPTNVQVTSALVAQAVPADRECIPNLSTVIQGVVDFVTVASQTTESGSTGDSIAQQALQVANTALAAAQAAQASIPQQRNSGTPVAIPTGDSAMPLTWSPAMPDTNYEVRGTYYGTTAFPASYFAFFVEDGSRTVNGCIIRLNNTPANFKFSWTVTALG
jgi:hypothetical protein